MVLYEQREKEVSLCRSESAPFSFPRGVCLLIFGWTSQTCFMPLQGSVTFVRGFLWRPWVPVRIRVLQLLLSRLSTLGISSTLARSVLVPILDSFFFFFMYFLHFGCTPQNMGA